MASTGDDQDSDDLLTLVCSEFNYSNLEEMPDDSDEIIISTADINDLPSNLAHKLLKIDVSRNRQINFLNFHLINFELSKFCMVLIVYICKEI